MKHEEQVRETINFTKKKNIVPNENAKRLETFSNSNLRCVVKKKAAEKNLFRSRWIDEIKIILASNKSKLEMDLMEIHFNLSWFMECLI